MKRFSFTFYNKTSLDQSEKKLTVNENAFIYIHSTSDGDNGGIFCTAFYISKYCGDGSFA